MDEITIWHENSFSFDTSQRYICKQAPRHLPGEPAESGSYLKAWSFYLFVFSETLFLKNSYPSADDPALVSFLSLPCFSPKDVEYFFCQGTKKRTGYLPFVFQIHSQLFSIVLSTQEMELWAVWQGSPALWLLVWPTGIPCRDQREEGVSMRSWLPLLSELCPLNRGHRSSHKSSFLLHFFTSEKPTQ